MIPPCRSRPMETKHYSLRGDKHGSNQIEQYYDANSLAMTVSSAISWFIFDGIILLGPCDDSIHLAHHTIVQWFGCMVGQDVVNFFG